MQEDDDVFYILLLRLCLEPDEVDTGTGRLSAPVAIVEVDPFSNIVVDPGLLGVLVGTATAIPPPSPVIVLVVLVGNEVEGAGLAVLTDPGGIELRTGTSVAVPTTVPTSGVLL
jgi:hypothetical protein